MRLQENGRGGVGSRARAGSGAIGARPEVRTWHATAQGAGRSTGPSSAPASARATSVLPVPGTPWNRIPLQGGRQEHAWSVTRNTPLASHGGRAAPRIVCTPLGRFLGRPTWAGAGPCPQTGRGTAWAAAPFRAAGAPRRLRKKAQEQRGQQTTQIRPGAAHAAMRHASQLDAAAPVVSPKPATEEKSVPEMLLTTVVSTVGCCCTAGGCGAPWPVVQRVVRGTRERGRR